MLAELPILRPEIEVTQVISKIKKDICGTARFFENKLTDSKNLYLFLQRLLIESVLFDLNAEGMLLEKSTYWQLFFH